jgi:alpha-tubulin suppressor-like RCC1 family protein
MSLAIRENSIFICVALGLIACAEESSVNDSSASAINVQLAITTSNLPKCNKAEDGKVWYVWSSAKFYVCKSSASTWVETEINGYNAAVRATQLNPEAQCPTGGAAIEFGLDTNRNYSLETSEVTSSVILCNGEAGPQGATGAQGANGTAAIASVVKLSKEAPGVNCLSGGTRIETGPDLNANGLLSDDEVTQTQYACNGVVPPGFAGVNSVSAFTDHCATLSWYPAEDNVTSAADIVYDICMSYTPGDCAKNFVALATTEPGATTYNFFLGSLPLGSNYFLVRARNSANIQDSNAAEVQLPISQALPLHQMALGAYHTCDGRTCWGLGEDGQLGLGNTNNRSTVETALNSGMVPTIMWPSERYAVSDRAAGGGHTCAVFGNLTVACAGRNSDGQLGDGTSNNQLSPVTVLNMTDLWGTSMASSVTAGASHTCASMGDGTVRCWGANRDGQLGDGTTTGRVSPVVVQDLVDAVEVAAGTSHTCALLASGRMRCWGSNSFGELGDGTKVAQFAPVLVANLDDAVALAVGGNHSCAVTASGGLKCWGNNANGQLGDGTKENRPTPISVEGLHNVVSVAAGFNHTCALLADQAVRCWGANALGQLGDGTTYDSALPVVGPQWTNAIAVKAGGNHTCLLSPYGNIQCAGDNSYGQLGDGTTTNRFTPVWVPASYNPTN